jgi:NAD(P)-dependent dehydrogenase (short-subunit alcohol dehydrogenase family)
MARVLVTGSTTGLGRAAVQALLDAGHDVIAHARNLERAADVGDLAGRATGVVIGDLSSHGETREVAEQVNALGNLDAVIHNAGVYAEPERITTEDGHPRVLAVNVLAPYLLTALIRRPSRLIYLSSDMHVAGRATLDDIDWTNRPWDGVQAYSDSKLLVTALAAAVARRWPDVCSNAVDPGWVPTRMGGPSASDNLTLGHQTQVWLATSDDRAATVSGKYWYHQRTQDSAPAVRDVAFQDAILRELERITREPLP